MKFFILAAAILNVAMAGHVAVRMPFLNSAGVTYVQNQYQQEYNPYLQQQLAYSAPQVAYQQQEHYAYPTQAAYAHEVVSSTVSPVAHIPVAVAKAPVAVGYAQVPVKTHVEVPTVHHVSTVTDVPFTKIEAQHAVIQSVVDVAKPAAKTRKFEVRRPAIQKQFYDIEERTIVRPVGSALVELDEPLSNGQTGPSLVHSLDNPHDVSVSADHGISVTPAPVAVTAHAVSPVAVAHAHAPLYQKTVAITPAPHTIAITPTPHTVAITPSVHHHYAAAPVAVPVAVQKELHYPAQYIQQQHPIQEHIAVSSTPSPLHVSTPVVVSSTPAPYLGKSIVVDDSARNFAYAQQAYAQQAYAQQAFEAEIAQQEAIAHARSAHSGHLVVETQSNGAPLEHHVPQVVSGVHVAAPAVAVKHTSVIENNNEHEIRTAARNLNHLSPAEAHDNQQKLINLLTAQGGVAEVGFERDGYSQYVGDAGITRARVLSATPAPHLEPVEEKVKTRRIVVSRPVQTLQEIDVVEPATKLEKVAINQPTVIKTARVGYQRVESSVPVLGKTLAPAISHAQVPVSYYHKK